MDTFTAESTDMEQVEEVKICPSSDFYIAKNANLLKSTIMKYFNDIRGLDSLVTDYMGLRIVTEGDVVLMEGYMDRSSDQYPALRNGDQKEPSAWICVRLFQDGIVWRAEPLVTNEHVLVHALFSGNKIPGCIDFIRDTFPMDQFNSNENVLSNRINECFTGQSLVRFLFISTLRNDHAPQVMRLSREHMEGIHKISMPLSHWQNRLLGVLFPLPRCSPPACLAHVRVDNTRFWGL